MDTTYFTLAKESSSFFKEKSSKFIGMAVHCTSEEDVKSFLKKWKAEHPKAGHLCYAFSLEVLRPQQRAADDGEPSNSAGAPILGQITSFNLSNVLIGVLRYYGGTKLGVGGLIQAYKQAAREAIENNQIIERELMNTLELNFAYSIMPQVMTWIKQQGVEVLEQEMNLDCKLRVLLPLQRFEELKEMLLQLDPQIIKKEILGK